MSESVTVEFIKVIAKALGEEKKVLNMILAKVHRLAVGFLVCRVIIFCLSCFFLARNENVGVSCK